MSLWALVLGAAVLLTGPDAFAQGCAMCATYVNEADPVARGMKFSVLFLMAMPFTMLAAVGGWFFYVYRGSRQMPALRALSAQREEGP
jgi:hypothetical protein